MSPSLSYWHEKRQNCNTIPLLFYWYAKQPKCRNFFAENGEKTWGELGIFLAFAITETPYNSRVFDARSSKQHWGFWIRAAPVYIAAPRRAKLFFENKKVLSRSRERTSKQNDAKSKAKSMRNEAKFVSRISFIGFRKQVAGKARQEKCGDSAEKFMEKCKLYLDFSADLCYHNTIENYGRMKNAPT